MKLLILQMLFLLFPIKQQTIEGQYIMQFEAQYSSQNCTIHFKNNTYKRKLLDGKTITGKVEFEKNDVVLKDKNTNLQMAFFKIDIERDTIFFKTRDVNDKLDDSGDIMIYSGKLIKVK